MIPIPSYPYPPPPPVRVVGGPDAHGVTASAGMLRLLRLLRQGAEDVEVASEFPGSTPMKFAEYARSLPPAQKHIIVDIPVNVRAPQQFIEALGGLLPVWYFDHHGTTLRFVPAMLRNGIVPVVTESAIAMHVAMGLAEDEEAWRLGLIGAVADRDPAVKQVASEKEIEELLRLAYGIDWIVRNPRSVDGEPARLRYRGEQGRIAALLAEGSIGEALILEKAGEALKQISNVAAKASVVAEGDIALLIEYPGEAAKPPTSSWVHKATEWLMHQRAKDFAIAVVPAFDRQHQTVMWDVRVYQYWLSEEPEYGGEALKKAIRHLAITGNVVGSGKLVSLRLPTREMAVKLAKEVYEEIEGRRPSAARLISEAAVARALRRDFEKLLRLLERCCRQ